MTIPWRGGNLGDGGPVLLGHHASRAQRPSGIVALAVGRRAPIVEAADFYDLDGDGLEPGEKPVQSCLILERPVYHRLDRLDRGGEPVEVK
jgi:hypothetical protein